MLQFTNHPLVDIGVAVISDYFDAEQPEQITNEQLKNFAEYLEKAYSRPYFRSFLFVLFPNSAFINANMKEENRKKEIERVLYGFLDKESLKPFQCVFCGQPAHFRAYRQHIPLLTGEGLINFFPSNRIGLETCPYCLLAIQAFPIGSLKVSGQAFFVHSDDQSLVVELVHNFRRKNEDNLLLEDAKQVADAKHPKTLFINELINVDNFIMKSDFMGSVTVYHLTNYGTNADIAMYHLPMDVISFIRSLRGASYIKTWNQMVWDGWITFKKRDEFEKDQISPYTHKNLLYEDFFDLPDKVNDFIRRHLLGGIERRFLELSQNQEIWNELNYWAVAELILIGVAQVNSERVEKTKQFADKLVAYLLSSNDKNFFRQLFYHGGRRNYDYDQLRNLFLKTNMRVIKESNFHQLPVTFDDFVEVFEEWEDTYHGTWRLGRDLVLLRVMERLYQEGWFTKEFINEIKISLPEDSDETINQ